jgi:DNA-binding NtrC family response regulator
MNSGNGRVLLVDDDASLLENLAAILKDQRFAIATAADGQEALEKLETWPADVVVTDLVMPRLDGFALLRELRKRSDLTPAIVLTGFGDIDKALSVIHELDAYWYLEKPVRPGMLRSLLTRAVQHSRLLRETAALKRDLDSSTGLGSLVGQSACMQEAYSLIRRAAPSSASVLITGPSGTGKELVARELHRLSPRASQPFIAVNCAALPDGLIESELFGHEKGAFTGATERRPGCFELANGGTLFLDEISEMPMPAQSKLLRVLEERQVRRLASAVEIPVDVRVVAATNRPLDLALRDKKLREDLYFRLNVFTISLQPLKDRMEDLPLLIGSLIHSLNEKHGTAVTTVHPDALDRLREYDWPGNVRELRNAIERATILADKGCIDMRHVFLDKSRVPEPAAPVPASGLLTLRPGKTLDAVEAAYVDLTLDYVKHNRAKAARVLGISLRTLQTRIARAQKAERESATNETNGQAASAS